MFMLAICGVTSFVRLRIAAGCIIVLTIVLMLQGAAAYHLGYNARLFLLDRTASDEDAEIAEAGRWWNCRTPTGDDELDEPHRRR